MLSVKVLSEKTCRLRHGLNVYCLLKVFDYLRPYDLIQVCKVDKYFKELIITHLIKNKILNLGFVIFESEDWKRQNDFKQTHGELSEIFETFGRSMRKFKISMDNFTKCLKTIIKYCEPATLTDIQFAIARSSTKVDAEVMHRSMPFFSNLRRLIFASNFDCTEFLTAISETASNIQIVDLRNVILSGIWLKNMHNLCELRLLWSGIDSPLRGIKSCLRLNPQLRVFKFMGKQDITTIVDDLKHCLNLRKFSDISRKNPYDRFGAAMISRYNFLETFPHLTSVTLTSFTFCGCDLYYPLMILATKNIVKLRFSMNHSNPIVLDKTEKSRILRLSLPNFSFLKTIEIYISSQLADIHKYTYPDPKWGIFHFRSEFILHFISQLKNLQNVKLLCCDLRDVYKILEFVPNIRALDISEANLTWIEIEKILKAILRIRQLKNAEINYHLLHFVSNNEYRDHVENYYNIQSAATTSFRSFGWEWGVLNPI